MDENTWIVKRSQLRQLLIDQPNWTNQMYADTLSMSVSWVQDWKRVFKVADPDDETVVYARPRHRRTPFDTYDQQVIDTVLEIRDHPPEYCPKVAGPAVIQYELSQQLADTDLTYPTSTSTIWKILDCHQRIIRVPKVEHEPFERPDPLIHWEIDYSDITTIPPEEDGKKQHAAEMLNVIDRGTSILIESAASGDYTAETTILALAQTFLINGVPNTITLDRDPRFIGGYQGNDFPSAVMRFLLCLEISIDICPPRRPDLKPFVERVHRTIQQECIQKHKPTTVMKAKERLDDYRLTYNGLRPHQGSACHNQPPYKAFPHLPILPGLPRTIDPDAWLKSFHGRLLRRRVQTNGSIKVDNRSYYVGKARRGQQVHLTINAEERLFRVSHGREVLKTIPIKGLYDEVLTFEDYLTLIIEEARTEWRKTKRLVRERRLNWAA